MSNDQFRRDFESIEDYRERVKRDGLDQPLMVETDIGKVLDATDPVTVKPGNLHARNAMKYGREDDYENRMRNRYGGDW